MSEANEKLGSYVVMTLSTGESYLLVPDTMERFKAQTTRPDFIGFTTIYGEELIANRHDIVSLRLITPSSRLAIHGMQRNFTEVHEEIEDIFNADEGWKP